MGMIEEKQKVENTPPPQDQTGMANQGAIGEEQPSPQEQDAMDKVVLASLKVIYDQNTHQGIVDMLTQGKADPAKALADTTTLIITQVDKKSGGKVPELVILPAAADVLGELGNLATKAGIFQVDEKISGQAMQKTILGLAEQYGVAPEDVQALLQSMPKDQIQQMVQQQSAFNQGAPAQAAPAPAPMAPPAQPVQPPMGQ